MILRGQLLPGLWWLVLLVISVLGSALAVVYVSHYSRHLFSELQILLNKESQLQVQWGQLLLEHSTWSAPARIEKLAVKKLNMVVPDAAATLLIRSIAQDGGPNIVHSETVD